MTTRTQIWISFLMIVSIGATGCRRNIVRAAPASVAPPPAVVEAPPQPEPAPAVAAAEPAPVPEPEPEPAPAAPAAKPAPVRPRPAPAEAEAPKPKAEPEPEPPQISPALSPKQQADATRRTTDDIRVAERNLQMVGNKRLNASQNDLIEKVRGFLGQSHEAIRANDWVRAQDLAHKAQILSSELIKSL